MPESRGLLWREWNGDFVVFNPASGDTHLRNTSAGGILRLLEESPATVSDLSHVIARHSDESPGAELENRVMALLTELDELGLIEPVDP